MDQRIELLAGRDVPDRAAFRDGAARPRRGRAAADTSPIPGRSSLAWWLSGALVVASLVAAVPTFVWPGLLHGPAVSIGTARGTALIVSVVAVPVLVGSMLAAARGSVRALITWLGAAVYLLYNSVLFLFGTPFNQLFLLYVAMFSLSLWAIGSTIVASDVGALHRLVSDSLPVRSVAVFTWVVVVLNSLAWLGGIVPTIADATPGSFLVGSGMTTNPVYVQDLAIWLPLAAVGAGWLWRREAWGFLLTATLLVFWVIESVGIATDQWFGARADSTTDFANAAVAPAFLIAAVVVAVPAALMLRAVAPASEEHRPDPHPQRGAETVDRGVS